MLTLDVLIVTIHPEGIERVAAMELPRVEGVSYVVSWQMPGSATVPAALVRPDVRIIRHDTTGLSVNRNHAIAAATADVCLIADDDLRYTPEQLRAVTAAFEAHPEIDYATFRYSGSTKQYPAEEFDMAAPPRGYYITEVELAFRREAVQGVLRFSPHLGLGSRELLAGEGEMFWIAMRGAGLRGRYFPVTIVHHANLSTGFRLPLPRGVVMAKGVFLYMYHPHTWPIHVGISALRERYRRRCGFFNALVWLWRGARRAPRLFTPKGLDRPQTQV